MQEPEVSEVIVRGIVVGSFAENCWIIGNRRSGEAVCVDPGDQPDDVLALARDMGVQIRYIANSHAHIDHILGVRAIREATGARFLLHEGDLGLLRGVPDLARRFGMEAEQPPTPTPSSPTATRSTWTA